MSIEITNMDEFKKELRDKFKEIMFEVGQEVEIEIRNEVEKMHLMGKPSNLHQRGYISSVEVKGNEVAMLLETGLKYAVYLEYGTYSYFDSFGVSSFPATPDKKKMHMTAKEKKNYPKGMQPFAPIRRVLWNKQKMEKIVNTAINSVK